MKESELKAYKKAGAVAKEVVAYAKEIIKPGVLLLEIVKKIEAKVKGLGGELAFPVNLSIDDIAAHYHPDLDDETCAQGLLKVDIGIHVNGYIADTAFSLDLTPDGKYKELIEASQDALENALKLVEKNPSLHEVGLVIQEAIEKKGFSPIINLSGHSLAQYELHSGVTIPNYGNNNENKLGEGGYAIEPFATTGQGKIYEGPASNIYSVVNPKNTRSSISRKIFDYVWKKHKLLPFSLREVQEKFGAMARLGIRELEQAGIIKNYPQLIEKSHAPVSQAEHTFVKMKDGIVVMTK